MSEGAAVERTEEPGGAAPVEPACAVCGGLGMVIHRTLSDENPDGEGTGEPGPCPACDARIERVAEQGERIREMVEAEAERAESDETEPEEVPPIMQHDPHTRTCPTCAGFGVTLTGSLVDGQETRECIDCGARGWQEKLQRATGQPLTGDAVDPNAEAWAWG